MRMVRRGERSLWRRKLREAELRLGVDTRPMEAVAVAAVQRRCPLHEVRLRPLRYGRPGSELLVQFVEQLVLRVAWRRPRTVLQLSGRRRLRSGLPGAKRYPDRAGDHDESAERR